MKHFSLILISILAFNIVPAKSQIQKDSDANSVYSRGILISPNELYQIRDLARTGKEPHQTDVAVFIDYIDSLMLASYSWPELGSEIVISGRSSGEPIQLSSTGGKLVYGAAIAWHLTDNEKYASYARKLILDLTRTYGYRDGNKEEFHWGAQGILNLARGGTTYIYGAVLLEGWQGWTVSHKLKYQIWLRDVMYAKVAWASRTRKNNWGVAGSFSAALISYYLQEHPEWELEEISPSPNKLSPQEAFKLHNAFQFGRLKTSNEWEMDAKAAQWGILPNGAIPEEIRRGKDPIDGDYLASNGSGTKYTMTHIEHLTAHAEFLYRLGDSSLYDHVENDGSGSLLQAYMFVINNPVKSHCFTPSRINALYMAYQYYKNPAMLKSLKACGPGNISGQRLALFGRLTHAQNINFDYK
jgi:hypothetical protein